MTHGKGLFESVRQTLIDADDLYTMMIEAGENPNLDSVGYTSQVTLDVFQRLLGRPDLKLSELENLLRQARSEVRQQIGPRPYVRVPRPVQTPDHTFDWSRLMAKIVVDNSNQNYGQPTKTKKAGSN